MTDNHPSINFVGRANANNGVTNYIDIIDGIKPYEAGCMTISLGGEYLGFYIKNAVEVDDKNSE